MELDEYLFRNKISLKKAAYELNICYTYLHDIKSKRVKAGQRLAKSIEKWSNGNITVDTLINTLPQKCCPHCGKKMSRTAMKQENTVSRSEVSA